ncbi:MAG: hypothetical protein MIO90_03410, partial [Methanomassiliicoccales archaeon]|nr:hypothetical protein [Methanomassiliicoccales archaeon]
MPPKKVPTVRKVDLTEILLVASGLFLLQGGMWNLSFLTFGAPAFNVILGLIATAVGLLMIMMVIMPSMFKQMAEIMDMMVIVLAAVFILWSLVILFTDDFGSAGDAIFVGGFGLLMAGLMRMGLLK